MRRNFAFLLVLAVTSALPAMAQPFEVVYGPGTTSDQGARRVEPVNLVNCPNAPVGGFISAGTTNLSAANSDVYVVRVKTNGNPLWERTYDLGGAGNRDEGRAIVELADGTGFVVLANTTAGGVYNTVLMKIDCLGAVVWNRVYRWSPTAANVRGIDLIQATTGDVAFGTAAGDLVVAGYATNTTPNDDAYLMRTKVNGALIWHRTYSTGVTEQFAALTEAAAPTGTPTKDLVAVGTLINTASNQQALAARVSGNNGAILGGNHCYGTYGDTDIQSLFSVIELRSTGFAGDLVLAGLSNGAANSDDILLLRTKPSPCTPLAESRIGGLRREVALDLREVLAPIGVTGVTVGDLAVTGDVADLPFTVSDVPLLFVAPTALNPLTGKLYGNHLPRVEVGTSLERIPGNGFIISGFSTSDKAAIGDPRDLYLVASDFTASTGCDTTFFPPYVSLTWSPTVLTPTLASPFVSGTLNVPSTGISTAFPACP